MTSQYQMWTDGGARGNPGPSAIGVRIALLKADGELVELQKLGRYIGETTNNQAEYQALVAGLESLKEYTKLPENQTVDKITVYTDSQLMAYQITGRYKVKNEELRPHYLKSLELLSEYREYTIIAIPRAQNQIADQLVNQALDKALGRI